MDATWNEQKIKVHDLHLWSENARFPDRYFNESETELIKFFCQHKTNNDYKIENLASEIVQDRDLPQLEKMVVLDIEGQYVVIEGNRRLTAYKLLIDPSKAPDEKTKNFFLKLKGSFHLDNEFALECLVTSSKKDAYRFVDRKHIKGNNEVGWGDQERSNHKVRKGDASLAARYNHDLEKRILSIHGMPQEYVDKVLGRGYVSIFKRILNSSEAKELFNITYHNDQMMIGNKDFDQLIKVIIFNVLEKKDKFGNVLDSRSLNKQEDIRDYLAKLKVEDAKRIDIEIDSLRKSTLFDTDTFSVDSVNTSNKVRILPKSGTRSYLIPKECRLRIESPTKINNIYHELRSSLIINDNADESSPNAVGVLFRVFLECSLDVYASRFGHSFTRNDNLAVKIDWVVPHLVSRGYKESEFAQIKRVRNGKGNPDYLSMHTFNAYVHSSTLQPTSSELKTKWDNLQSFFEILWSSLHSQK